MSSKWSRVWQRVRALRPAREALQLPNALLDLAPLDLRIVGRTILHTMVVGLAAGLIGAAFFWSLEALTVLLLEDLAGYRLLRAHGEEVSVGGGTHTGAFLPWVLVFLPALGGLVSGFIGRWVPEVRGGGGDTTIEAFHKGGGLIRRRVIWAKSLASLATLGTGGAGGREGPTMMIGGAIGSAVGRMFGLSSRERRILLVAGIAAGIAAVFRTPLGAALLAVEVLYRDDFEADALVPGILASVVAYSVVISLFGESIMFAHAARYPFTPSHLPYYALMAVMIALLGHLALGVFGGVHRLMARAPGPEWVRPAWGGLVLGVIVTPVIMLTSDWTGTPGQGLGLLGGGYGAVQAAITGAPWLTGGWVAVGVLVLLALGKLLTTAVTIGSGGSAGDFAPSLAIGGLFGGAFGHAAQLTVDPSIDPGAFALVGMGAFYGGIAHVPLSALVLVCELAGSYDLLVPLMLALGISFVALRRRTLYPSQVPSQRDSAAHREEALVSALETTTVREVMQVAPRFERFAPDTTAAEMMRALAAQTWQDTFPVLDRGGELLGLVKADALRKVASDAAAAARDRARDLMQPPVVVLLEDSLRTAGERLVRHQLRELPVLDGEGRIAGFIDEEHITRRYLGTLTAVAGPRPSRTLVRIVPPRIVRLETEPRPVVKVALSPPEPGPATSDAPAPPAPPVPPAPHEDPAPSRLLGRRD